MSYITFSPNQLVYIKDIGYATLINCGDKSTISQKVQSLPQKKQSIYFDPDLFNTQPDTLNSKKSIEKIEQQKIEQKKIEQIKQLSVQQKKEMKNPDDISKQQKKQLNCSPTIVKARLQGTTNVYIFTPEYNLKKSITLIIKLIFFGKKEQIVIQTDITKTIQTLKKNIFLQIGQTINNYYNIKLFSINPTLSQLNQPTKTISQYIIKDYDHFLLTADYSFNFVNTVCQSSRFKIIINGNILQSTKPPKKQQSIPLPPPPLITQIVKAIQLINLPINLPTESLPDVIKQVQQKLSIPQQKKQIQKQAQIKKQQKNEQQIIQSSIIKCNVNVQSGKKYWQFKVQKVPIDQQDLWLGVLLKKNDSLQKIWILQPNTGKIIYGQLVNQKRNIIQEHQNYGFPVKVNDLIGILVIFGTRGVSISFYKNSVNFGQAWNLDIKQIIDCGGLVPIVFIGGQSQVTLDSRAQLPLDSYRLK